MTRRQDWINDLDNPVIGNLGDDKQLSCQSIAIEPETVGHDRVSQTSMDSSRIAACACFRGSIRWRQVNVDVDRLFGSKILGQDAPRSENPRSRQIRIGSGDARLVN